MGMFANTVFSVLLGWVQTAASWLWSLVTNTDVSAWLQWVLDNWLPLTILLCLAGLTIDFIVYLIRWQPYRVWQSFLRNLTARKKKPDAQAENAQSPLLQRTWVYADGSTTVEDVPASPLPGQAPSESEQLSAPIRPVRRAVRRAAPEQAYHQPVYPPQWREDTKDEQGGNE